MAALGLMALAPLAGAGGCSAGAPNGGEPTASAQAPYSVGGCNCPQTGSCSAISFSDVPANGQYYITTFAGGGGMACGGSADGTWAYVADSARFGCGAHLLMQANGKQCVAQVSDCGPNQCVEAAASNSGCAGHHPIIDASPFITEYLYGVSSSGWSDQRVVTATPVSSSVAVGCPGGSVQTCTNQCSLVHRVAMTATPAGKGYWVVDSAGHVYPNGNAGFFGDLTGATLAKPVVGMAATPSGRGYWLAASDGGVFSFGDAGFHGSEGGKTLAKPVVGMAATPDGGGYWLVASDGGIFAFGDAGFYGSAGGTTLAKPVVGMATTPDGKGYWLVAADGGIFAYGDAGFHGSAGGTQLNQPVVGMAATHTGQGYWLVAADGGIFSYGDAGFHGSAGGTTLNQPIVGMSGTADDGGYWLVAADGGIFSYGDASYFGNALGSSCSGASPVACVKGSNGCSAPQNQPACASGQVCAHGTCQATCTDACTGGTTRCSGGSVEVCGYYGSAPCNVWSAPMACPSGQTCSSGVCGSPACTDDCEPGAARCAGGQLEACTGTKAGGCHTWGAPTPCASGQTCSNGGCVAPSGGAGGAAGSGGAGGAVNDGGPGGAVPDGTGGATGSGGAGGASTSPGSASAHASGSCALHDGPTPKSSWAPLALIGFVEIARRRRRGKRVAR